MYARNVFKMKSNLIEDRNLLNSEPLMMATKSRFTVSPVSASQQVSRQSYSEDDRQCYLMQITLHPVYTGNPNEPLPHICYKRLPRLINGIPLGAGVIKNNEMDHIRWRYIEGLSGGGHGTQTFISEPMYRDEAEDAKRSFKDRLLKQSRSVFGDVTVKVSVILSQCVHYDEEFYINDVADTISDGLHFRD
ncbi:uncharacterized protein LOC106883755 isoform X1 [Octopus bimaculoides]|nr:uncharacterized protein LOC106883755 isoform X1 [Octopus bimaculoides]